MKNFKLLLALVFFAFGLQNSHSQIYKFQTTGFSVMEKNEKGKWGKWSDLEKTSVVITLDTNKNRIVVYSQEIQLYKIAEYGVKEENDSDIIYPFVCEDSDGERFTISIITRKSQNGRKQLYINQKNVIIVYNIVNFPSDDDLKN